MGFVPGAQANIHQRTKAGAVAYQETPWEGPNVQRTHIEDRDSDHFVGCFVSTNSRYHQYDEVRASGAGN